MFVRKYKGLYAILVRESIATQPCSHQQQIALLVLYKIEKLYQLD